MPDDSDPSELDDLLTQAREASPQTRIERRDPIASFGEAAVDAMADWIGDPRLAAFAIRVLERLGRLPTARAAVIDVLRSVDRAALSEPLVRDVDASLLALGASSGGRHPAKRRPAGPVGRPGIPGRGYWVMRTSQWERPFVWAEAKRGRLR